jgi:hypothetical protein
MATSSQLPYLDVPAHPPTPTSCVSTGSTHFNKDTTTGGKSFVDILVLALRGASCLYGKFGELEKQPFRGAPYWLETGTMRHTDKGAWGSSNLYERCISTSGRVGLYVAPSNVDMTMHARHIVNYKCCYARG